MQDSMTSALSGGATTLDPNTFRPGLVGTMRRDIAAGTCDTEARLAESVDLMIKDAFDSAKTAKPAMSESKLARPIMHASECRGCNMPKVWSGNQRKCVNPHCALNQHHGGCVNGE